MRKHKFNPSTVKPFRKNCTECGLSLDAHEGKKRIHTKPIKHQFKAKPSAPAHCQFCGMHYQHKTHNMKVLVVAK